MEKISPEELAEFREIFNLVDRDGGGSISKLELAELLETLGIDADVEEIDRMIAEIDQDGNGTIDFDEFVAVMAKKVETSYSQDQVKEAFKTFEVPGHPGLIKAENLIKALGTYSTEKLTEIQLKELVNQMDSDGSGF
eukprot:gene20033-24368_t